MNELPVEIEQKLEQLPYMEFDVNEEFQQLIMSDLFSDIFNYYKENYLPDVLKNKSETYQRISLYLNLTGQGDKLVEETEQLLYRRPVPSIDTFLKSDFYHGRLSATTYPFWKEKLKEIFAENSPIRQVIYSGCIGSGKSTAARKAMVYMLYKILCLRYPRAIYNIDPDATIAAFIVSVTMRQVYDTNILPFVKLLENMPCFQRVMSVRSFDNFDLNNPKHPFPFFLEKSSSTLFFPNNIILTSGSQISHTVGYNIPLCFCFTENNTVTTQYGVFTFKRLKQLFDNGYKLKTYCLDKNNNKHETFITNIQITGQVTELMRLYINDTQYIECTPNHLFVITNPNKNDKTVIYENGIAYKEVKDLTENDDIASENNAYVYALIDNRKDSKNYNKPFYIGVSSHLNPFTKTQSVKYSRAYSHFTRKSLKNERNFCKKAIIEKILNQGLTPEIQILKENICMEEAFELEKTLVTKYGRIVNHTGILSNCADGGRGGSQLPTEVRNIAIKNMINTKRLKKEKRLAEEQELLEKLSKDFYFLFVLGIMLKQRKDLTREKYRQAALRPERVELSRKNRIKYNKSEAKREATRLSNHLKPRVSSLESKLKLARSQRIAWNKKSEEEKKEANLAKSIGRAWNIIKRIEGNKINEEIFDSHRTKDLKFARAEPRWKSIIEKAGGIEQFLKIINDKYHTEFYYEI